MVVVAAADDADRAFPVDLLIITIITEAVVFSTFLNQAAKIVFARERPFVHGLPSGTVAAPLRGSPTPMVTLGGGF